MRPDFLEDLDEVAPTLYNVIPEKKQMENLWVGVCGVNTRTYYF